MARLSSLVAGGSVVCLVLLAAGGAQGQEEPRARFSRTAEAEIEFQEGLLRYSSKELRRAEAIFRELVEEDPADAEAWYYLGLAQLDQAKYAQAAESLDQSLRLDPTPTEVRAARASALIRTRQYEQAEEDIAVLEQDPRWEGLAAYLRGRMLYQQRQYPEAARAFARARELGGAEQEAAEFYEGLTYWQMKEYVQARTVFRDASGLERDPAVSAASRQIDTILIDQIRATRKYEFSVATGVEYDDNVSLLGVDVELPDDADDEADFKFILEPEGSYTLYDEEKLEVGVEGNAQLEWHFEEEDQDLESYQAGPFASYRFSRYQYGSVRYGINYFEFGSDPYMLRQFLMPQYTIIEPERGFWSFYYQPQHRELYDSPSNRLRDRDGWIHTVGVIKGIDLPALFQDADPADLELSYRYELHDTDGADYKGDIHTVRAVVYVPLPVWDLRGDVGASFGYGDYDNPNSRDVNGSERRDTRWVVTAGLTKELSENWSLRADYAYTERDSNVVQSEGGDPEAFSHPFDFERQQIGLRLIYVH